MMHTRIGRVAVAMAAAGGLSAGGLVAFTGTAGADYGPGTAYQVEISANAHFLIPATGTKKVPVGAGIWLWFALTPSTSTGLSGTADYQGSDCQHNLVPNAPAGAIADSGSTTYVVTGTKIEIGPITLANGALSTITVNVPSTDGHYTDSSFGSVFSSGVPQVTGLFHAITGTIQVQVAP